MISINKEEAKILRESLPGVHIVRTMKQKSKRGHYYCEESRRAINFISALRANGGDVKKAGGNHRNNKKR